MRCKEVEHSVSFTKNCVVFYILCNAYNVFTCNKINFKSGVSEHILESDVKLHYFYTLALL